MNIIEKANICINC